MREVAVTAELSEDAALFSATATDAGVFFGRTQSEEPVLATPAADRRGAGQRQPFPTLAASKTFGSASSALLRGPAVDRLSYRSHAGSSSRICFVSRRPWRPLVCNALSHSGQCRLQSPSPAAPTLWTFLSIREKGITRVMKAFALAAFALLLGFFYTKTSAIMSRAVFGIGVITGAGLVATARYVFGKLLGDHHGWKFQNEVLLVDGATVAAPVGMVLYAEQAGLSPYQ